MSPVDTVHIHHEGSLANGGAPTDDVDRFAHGGYCCGIGATLYKRWRSPAENYATADWNGRDWTPCFSGDRHTGYPISDRDLELLHDAFMDAYNRGEVTATPNVVAHRDAGGSNATACPGDKCMDRFADVVAACRVGAGPTPTPPPDEEDDRMDLASAINHDGRPVVFQVGGDRNLYYRIRDAKGGNWGDWRHLSDGLKDFATVTAWANPESKKIEVWVTLKNGRTYQRWQTDDFAAWGDWTERTT